MEPISLVIFTCNGREHLLYKTINSFKNACTYKFSKIILAIDGQISAEVISYINPDLIIQSPERRGYVNSIANTLPAINTKYFFWLEDDWTFHETLDLDKLMHELEQHDNWTQIVYSKTGPLTPDLKHEPVAFNLYNNIHGFSANPCLCKAVFLQHAFGRLLTAPKGDKLGENGFENFLTKHFISEGLLCIIQDPVNHEAVSHAGYLESTPREWHMTRSLDEKPVKALIAMPVPTFWRKLIMAVKLMVTIPKLIFKQLINNEVYELCFRLLASIKVLRKHD